jgi:trk system potassium uptake protein TrkA
MTGDLDVIIAGGGRVGFQTADLLVDSGHDVILVEEDPIRCERLADEYVATIIEGDATRPSILKQANPERADVVAGLTGKTGTNLAVCMEAKQMASAVRTIARVDHPEGAEYLEYVDAIVFPERAGARVAANEITGADVHTFSDVTGRLEIMQIRVADGAPAAGKALSDVRFPRGSLVISDDEGEQIAGPKTTLSPGQRYVVAVEPDVTDEVMNLLRG